MPEAGLDETNAFVAVLEHKSFTAAAKQLRLSPPRVSELVRKLEERLGVRLIERTTRSVAPTVAGERLLARLRPLLDDYAAALDSISELRARPAGTLRLTVAPPAAEFVLSPVIARFLALYPDIALNIEIESGLIDIVAGRFDAGIRLGEALAPGMIAVRVSDEMPRVVVASPAYLARRGEPKTPQELTDHECIRHGLPGGGILPWRIGVKRRLVDVQAEGRLIVNDMRFAINATIDGAGLFQTPLAYVAADIAAGRLVTVLRDFAPPPIDGFFLYYASRRQVRPALKALVDFLRDTRKGPRRDGGGGRGG